MDDATSKSESSTIIKTATIVAIVISGLWALFWTHDKQLNDQNAFAYQDRVEALEQQLQQGSTHEQDLLNRYIEVLEINVALEKALATSATKLEYLQDYLSDQEMGDWERKYLQEKSSNDQIFESMARLEEEAEHLEEIQETLISDHQTALESERNKYLQQIDKLNSKLTASAKASKKTKKQASPVIKQAKATTNKSPTDYRSARLLSLINNTNDLSSRKKLDILNKVIPTVPDGITTSELTRLTSGMDSEDILSLIISSERHIQKTKNKKSISLLLSKMNNHDAGVASGLLIN